MSEMLRFTPENITEELHERCQRYGGERQEGCVCDRCEAVREIGRLREHAERAEAALDWAMSNEPGTPVPEWVDAVQNKYILEDDE